MTRYRTLSPAPHRDLRRSYQGLADLIDFKFLLLRFPCLKKMDTRAAFAGTQPIFQHLLRVVVSAVLATIRNHVIGEEAFKPGAITVGDLRPVRQQLPPDRQRSEAGPDRPRRLRR